MLQMPCLGRRKKRTEIKELLLILALKKAGPIGRYRLKKILDLSEYEGIVRLMLTDLEGKGIISASRKGCKLTRKGESLLAKSLGAYNIAKIKQVDLRSLGLDNSFCVHVRDHAEMIRPVAQYRDAAVRAGALGAIILKYADGILAVPNVYSDFSLEYPKLTAEILQGFDFLNGDVLILGFAGDEWKALEGALAVAIEMAKDTKHDI